MAVYEGIATINPIVPNRVPAITITIKISNGWDLTVLEKIYGWLKKLSTNCPKVKPKRTYIVFGRITSVNEASIKLVIVKILIKTAPIIGPTYGIRFRIAHKKAMIKAFWTPKIKRTIV